MESSRIRRTGSSSWRSDRWGKEGGGRWVQWARQTGQVTLPWRTLEAMHEKWKEWEHCPVNVASLGELSSQWLRGSRQIAHKIYKETHRSMSKSLWWTDRRVKKQVGYRRSSMSGVCFIYGLFMDLMVMGQINILWLHNSCRSPWTLFHMERQ